MPKKKIVHEPVHVHVHLHVFVLVFVLVPALRFAGTAQADEAAPTPDAGTAPAPDADAAPAAIPDPNGEPPPAAAPTPAEELEARLRALEDKNAQLADRVDQLEDDTKWHQDQLDKLAPLQSRLSGYIDFGLFGTTGNGAGTRTDVANTYFPEYAGVVPDTWVFMGDPLSTAINARGEPADTGESRALTFDSVNSGGKPSFILNTLSLNLFAGVGKHATVNGAIDFLPRGRDPSDPGGLFVGDYLDVKLGYLEYRIATHAMDISLFAGKFDSVLGYEYRSQDAPDRTTVTPSLICRYTCGHPLGVKARFRLPKDKLVLNLAITNGSSFQEQFPFSNEIDVNRSKTASGRLSFHTPLPGGSLEVGASGAYGAQDLQTSDSVYQWHFGGDLHLEWKDLELTAEYVKGKAPGQTEVGGVACGAAPCLHYQGAYGLVGYRVTNTWQPYVRADFRDAVHQSGASFVYLSKLARVTVGVRGELGTQVIVKAEYTNNRELGRIPQFPNDIFTSALVVKF